MKFLLIFGFMFLFTTIKNGFTADNIELINAVKSLDKSTQEINPTGTILSSGCVVKNQSLPPEEISENVVESSKTPDNFCSGNEEGGEYQRYTKNPIDDESTRVNMSIIYKTNKLNHQNMTEGFSITSPSATFGPVIEEGNIVTEFDPISPTKSYSWEFLGRGKEIVFTTVDSPVREEYDLKTKKVVERFSSTSIRLTNHYFFPRKVIPSIKTTADQFIVTMATGEKIVYDRKTGSPVNSVMKEVPSTNKVVRTSKYKESYSENKFKYEGDGIYLEVPITNDSDPRNSHGSIAVKGFANGVEQSCLLKADDLFTRVYGYNLKPDQPGYFNSTWTCTRMKFESDNELYQLIKKTCPNFKFSKLISNQ